MTQPSETMLRNLLALVDEDPALQQELRQWMLQFVRSNDELREDLRKEILTEELLQLPERFADLVRVVSDLSENFEAFAQETHHRLSNLESDVAELKGDVAELKGDVAELKGGQQRLERDVAGIKRDLSSLRDDVGDLKGDAALRATRIVTYDIADEMGHHIVRDLTRAEVRAMSREQSLPDIPRNGRRSFAVADAIIEVTTSNGSVGYVAVEASYTADERDTFRAIRNAHYLRRMTGQPAWAAISALRIDQRIQGMVDSGIVHWHQLEPEDFTPE
ncbi:MAG: hypothetical protein OXL37_03540 [Chloroflexota bacterium]|nr:hypothetical protein [Chloroflexota bacterium]MDE2958610.1 hypothetical protein [Chloroflexota bacterium]